MGRVQTGFKGITTGSTYGDGEMYSVVNLRRKGGALHPVSPHVMERALSERYEMYFIHRNEDYEHWIGVWKMETGGWAIYWNIDERNEGRKLITDNITAPVNAIEQNGNLLMFISDAGIYYALFRNGGYTWYGRLPELPALEWNCLEEVELETDIKDNANNVIGQYRGIKYSDYINRDKAKDPAHFNLSTMNQNEFVDLTNAIINYSRGKLTFDYLGSANNANYNKESGLFGGIFFDAFFVRYAFRLFDNSYIKLSPPILIMPSRHILDLLRMNITHGRYIIITPGRWGNNDVVSSDFMGFEAATSYLYITGFIPGLRYDLTDLNDYEGLISGIDIFLSPSLSLSQIENISAILDVEILSDGTTTGKETRIIEDYSSDMIKRVRDMSQFYLVKSLETGESTGGVYVPFPDKTDGDTIDNIRNLTHKEQLQDETQSIHEVGARRSFLYNSRLHLADTRTAYFRGFARPFFSWDKSFNADPVSFAPYGGYNGLPPVITYTTPQTTWSVGEFCIIEVEIQRGAEMGYVYAVHEHTDSSYSAFWHSAMLSYPDAAARRMTFYKEDSSGDVYRIHSFELKEHEFLNIAYYLSDGLKGVYFLTDGELLSPDERDELQSRIANGFSFSAPSELRVSETHNPLRFRNDNILTVGMGRIMNLGANVMDAAQFNYGAFPLFVFATDGVWTLRVGSGDIAYSVVAQPSYMEPPICDVICQTPRGVLFLIARGLCIINGSKVDFLSGAIEERPVALTFEQHASMSSLENYGNRSFTDHIRGVTDMIYNGYKNEVVILGEKDYNWVLSLDDMSFYMSTERLDDVVKGSAPSLLVVSDKDVLDFSREEGSAHVSFISRPLRYGTPDVKLMERIILRGQFYDVSDGVTVSHYSNDFRNFIISKGVALKYSDYRDLDLGVFHRAKFRSFTVSFAATLGPETVIEFMESEIQMAYPSTKMR